MEIKSGYKTTEFILPLALAVATNIVTILVGRGAITLEESESVTFLIGAFITLIVWGFKYISSRTELKQSQIAAREEILKAALDSDGQG